MIPLAAPKWEELGIELEVVDDNGRLIDKIKAERGNDEKKCCLDVVKPWLQGAGMEPKTWGVLVACLKDIDAGDAVQSIEENIIKGIKKCSFFVVVVFL